MGESIGLISVVNNGLFGSRLAAAAAGATNCVTGITEDCEIWLYSLEVDIAVALYISIANIKRKDVML